MNTVLAPILALLMSDRWGPPMGIAALLASVVVLLILSGFIAGSEIALVALSPAHVRALLDAGVPGAQAVDRLKRQPRRMLVTILLTNTTLNIGITVLVSAWATHVLGPASLGPVTLILTLLILVVGEIFPKALAQRYGDSYARLAARPIAVLKVLLFPILVVLEALVNLGLHPSRKKQAVASISPVHELKAMIHLASERGHLDYGVGGIVSGVFALGSKRVSEVMTPRSNIQALEAQSPLDDLRRVFVDSGRSRIPVYDGDLDHVVGIINMRAFLRAQVEGKTRIGDVGMFKAPIVSPDMTLDDALIVFQESRSQLALVVDAGQRVCGLVTMENVLEEIVGEMFDEKERHIIFVHPLGEAAWELRGDCPLDELRKVFRDFEPHEPPFKSVGSLFVDRSGKEPREGDEIIGNGYRMRIVKMKDRSLASIRVERLPPPA